MTKKPTSIFVWIGALALVAILGVGLVVGYLGFLPGVSDLMGTNKPRDLGVHYSEADYQSGLDKVPGHTVSGAQYLCVLCDYRSSGSVPVADSFTQEELTAQMNKMNSEKGPLKDIQVKLGDDGEVEMSALINDSRIRAPVYLKGELESVSDRRVRVKLDYAEVGRAGVSGEQAEQAQELADQLLDQFFTKNPGLSIQSLSIENGKVNFNGTLPQNVEGNAQAMVRSFG